jgi:hypothetical protein
MQSLRPWHAQTVCARKQGQTTFKKLKNISWNLIGQNDLKFFREVSMYLPTKIDYTFLDHVQTQLRSQKIDGINRPLSAKLPSSWLVSAVNFFPTQREYWLIGRELLAHSLRPPTVSKLSLFLVLPMYIRLSILTGGWGGAKSYVRERAWSSINHSILPPDVI